MFRRPAAILSSWPSCSMCAPTRRTRSHSVVKAQHQPFGPLSTYMTAGFGISAPSSSSLTTMRRATPITAAVNVGTTVSRRTFAVTFQGKPEEFLGHVQDSTILVASFSAKWCRPCKDIQPELRTLAEKYVPGVSVTGAVAPSVPQCKDEYRSSVCFFDVDITANETLAALHDIRCVPTFCVYLNGELFGTVEGASVARLDIMISEAAKEGNSGGAASPTASNPAVESSL